MASFNSVTLDGDPEKTLTFGCGMLVEVAEQIFSPERAAAERAAMEKEAADAEAALEAVRQVAADMAAFWAARHGDAPPKRPTTRRARRCQTRKSTNAVINEQSMR